MIPMLNLTCDDRFIVIQAFFAAIIAFLVQQYASLLATESHLSRQVFTAGEYGCVRAFAFAHSDSLTSAIVTRSYLISGVIVCICLSHL